MKRGSGCCVVDIYYTAALTSLPDSVSYIIFLFSEWRIQPDLLNYMLWSHLLNHMLPMRVRPTGPLVRTCKTRQLFAIIQFAQLLIIENQPANYKLCFLSEERVFSLIVDLNKTLQHLLRQGGGGKPG